MRRSFLRGLLICLLPTVLAGWFTYRAFQKELNGQVGFRRGIDLAGGTILVYEVDVEGMRRKIDEENRANRTKPDYRERRYEDEKPEMRELAEKIKKRIDPSDVKNVVVRAVGDSRVEIILPYAGSTQGDKEAANEEFAEDVRQQVKQAGVLEFRILANEVDDAAGLQAAQAMLDAPTPAVAEELVKRAKAGVPPPAPEGIFPVKLNDEELSVRYEWLELGPEERDSLGLSNKFSDPATATDQKGKARPEMAVFWKQVEKTRGKTYLHRSTISDKENKGVSYLLYSRKFEKEKPTKDEYAVDKSGNVTNSKQVEYFLLTRVSTKDAMKVTGDVRINASPDQDPDKGPSVRFSFLGNGPRRFGDLTERNFQPKSGILRHLAIVMDNKVVSAPYLGAVLRDGGVISGNFSQSSVNRLVNILRSGNLNADLKPEPVSTKAVGATLGESTIRKGLLSVVGSFAAVLIFMVIYYRFAGFVACVALFVNLLLTVGFMVAVNAAFTLPGLAGLVLMLGMAVDANVLIYERIREERERGATLVGAIRNGYDRAFGTIIDTHLTSIFTAIILYSFGNDSLKGFSVALTLGLVISLFTSLYVTRLMFDFWINKRWLTQLKMMKLFARPNFDFMKIRNFMFALTAFLTVAGLGLFLARGERNLNVDFTQGTMYGGRLAEGQERGLGATSDGKPGLYDLLGQKQQQERLAVREVIWLSKPESGNPDDDKERQYQITYADGKVEKVILANHPTGATPEAKIADLTARAAHLPDTSVEQVFLRGDDFPLNKSRSFTIRTTEREPELVQVMLDRLLRDEATSAQLLTVTKVVKEEIGIPGNRAAITVAFDGPVSPGAYLRLLARSLPQKQVDTATAAGVPSADANEAATEKATQRYKTIRVDLSSMDAFKVLNEPARAKEAAVREQELRTALADAKRLFEQRPAPDQLEVFDPALAAATRDSALFAILISWMAILAFLWFRFGSWTFGLAAVFCLIHDLCFTLGAIAVCHYLHDTTFGALLGLQDFKIDLAAVAALLTLVGYSVNDTIVVFDRIREVRGKNPLLTTQIINDSVNQTLSRTILAALTVFLVVVVLYIWGGEGVHLFAFVMVMGVIVGTYSSIYIAAPLLLIFGEGKAKATIGGGGEAPPPASEAAPAAMAT